MAPLRSPDPVVAVSPVPHNLGGNYTIKDKEAQLIWPTAFRDKLVGRRTCPNSIRRRMARSNHQTGMHRL